MVLLGSHEVTSPRSLLRSKSAQESGVLSRTWKVSLWRGSEAGLHLPHGICSCLSSGKAPAGPSTSRVKNKSQREPVDEQKFCWIAGSDHLLRRIRGVPEVFVLLLHPGTALCGLDGASCLSKSPFSVFFTAQNMNIQSMHPK